MDYPEGAITYPHTFHSHAFCIKGSCDHPSHRVTQYHARDSAWIERELGDVPVRPHVTLHNADNVLLWTTMDGNVQGYADRVEFWNVDPTPRTSWLDDLAQRDPEVALAFVLMGATGQEPRTDQAEGQPQ